ncbi:nuclear transport factor 2 family protein [Roseibium sediminicola]|uniref:Nuclear transport factor 2 family protein n=1 Tax=Roseibium sediminicola TaxID=2933272 RepID=A0ABT0H1J2_9HYPH|nr:nuclear transport factor 2 family protein [Roseibium sp. CAU 1639]MCK7614938.1 nuclear transport factor 2 family protein [Roseibium sp. CAU 1639]
MTPEQRATLDQFYAGATAQDPAMIRPLLTDNFSHNSPLMNFDNPDDYIAHLVNFVGRVTQSRFIAEGESVAHLYTLVAELPDGEKHIEMCDVFTFQGDKIVKQTLYTDSANFVAAEAA